MVDGDNLTEKRILISSDGDVSHGSSFGKKNAVEFNWWKMCKMWFKEMCKNLIAKARTLLKYLRERERFHHLKLAGMNS